MNITFITLAWTDEWTDGYLNTTLKLIQKKWLDWKVNLIRRRKIRRTRIRPREIRNIFIMMRIME